MQLLRPDWWIESYQLRPGVRVAVHLEELQLHGHATVLAIKPCPPVAVGTGSVVTGRFISRRVDNLLEVTLADGSRFTGTATHPVWECRRTDWVPLSGLSPGDVLDTQSGPAEITEVRSTGGVSDLFLYD